MAIAKYRYAHGHVEVVPAGTRRYLVVAGDGNGRSYILERALAKLKRHGGASVQRTGNGSAVYVSFPAIAPRTGKAWGSITPQELADWIANC